MVMSDPLSRAYVDEPCSQAEYCNEVEEIVLVDGLPISHARLIDFRKVTACDADLQILMSTVLEGWPSTQAEVPQEIRPYFSFKKEITVQNGLLFKGDRIIVPASLRKEMMEKVHSSHLGIEGCTRRAREVLYWPRMNAELKARAASRTTDATRNSIKALEKVGIDLLQIDRRQYLITGSWHTGDCHF